MKISILSICALFVVLSLHAQDTMDDVMDKRAREFHRVLGLSDKEAYKNFMKENYTKEYLEKPLKVNRVVKESDGSSSTTTSDKDTSLDNLDAKAGMFEQLHNDFGGAKISTLTKNDNKVELIIKSMGLKGKFTLIFNKEKPYLIEGLGVEADMEN